MAQLIVIFGLAECVLGWLQLLGFATSGNYMYPATGTFYNPGPYCGFLAVIVPVALQSMLSDKRKVPVLLSDAYLLLAMGLMPSLMGRTGWIAAALGCAVVVAGRHDFTRKPVRRGRLTVYAACVIVLGAALIGLLYFLKPDSARGRVLMWIVAMRAMIAHPQGVGWDRVAGAFGQAQEDYFAQYPDSVFVSVAGAPEYVFNEFLQIGIAFGIAGFIAFTAVVIAGAVTAWRTRRFGLCGAVTAFAAVCFSSYPLQFPEFYLLVFLLGTAIIFSLRNVSLWLKTVICAITGGLLAVPAYGMMERERQMREWDRVGDVIRHRMPESFKEECDSLVREMEWNAQCLFDYGKALREEGDFKQSNEVLKRGVEISSDPMFLNLIGRNHEDMGDTVEAEKYYRRSKNRLPNRLYPYYRIVMLYAEQGDTSSVKFRKAYDEAMTLPVKVASPATRQMREELGKICTGLAGSYRAHMVRTGLNM